MKGRGGSIALSVSSLEQVKLVNKAVEVTRKIVLRRDDES
ncbi:hypothetical protein LCGC14_1208190 [marine sediment metagenome]|uniref:Uncharacterized protein n=1 Tax=marine sediment metagenome TaxID=412755 RepID=A0A0F9LJA5_9ZZZZ